jgi:hypothetical protein
MSYQKIKKVAEKNQQKMENTIEQPKSDSVMADIMKTIKKEVLSAAKDEKILNTRPENVQDAADTIDRVTEYLKNSKVQEASNYLVEQMDDPSNNKTYAAMNSIRNKWNNFTPSTQKIAVLTVPAMGFLVKTGLLPIKGASREELRDTGKWIGPALKWGVKIGSYKWPELKELEPYIAPLIKLLGVESEILITSYDHLQATRRKRNQSVPKTYSD